MPGVFLVLRKEQESDEKEQESDEEEDNSNCCWREELPDNRQWKGTTQ